MWCVCVCVCVCVCCVLRVCSLTDREGVHPAPPVGGELHGHPGRREGVNECSLGGVPSGADVQGGLSTSHGEPARGTGVPLRVHHLLQQL